MCKPPKLKKPPAPPPDPMEEPEIATDPAGVTPGNKKKSGVDMLRIQRTTSTLPKQRVGLQIGR